MKIKVSIGIPVYNESTNVARLIEDIHLQERSNFDLDKILVISDGSSDDTVLALESKSYKNLVVVDGKDRLGKPKRVNQMFKLLNSDIVVILDADIRLKTKSTISDLISPLLKNTRVQLSSGVVIPKEAVNTTQKIALAGIEIWNGCRKGSDVSALYWCDGSIRAFGKKFYKRIIFPDASADEAYSYLECINMGYSFDHVMSAVAINILPSNLIDYVNQTKRFLKSPSIQGGHFGKELIEKSFNINSSAKKTAFINTFLKYPLWSVLYVLVSLFARISNMFDRKDDSKWKIITSTKSGLGDQKKKIIISNFDDIKNPYYGGGGAYVVHEMAKKLAKIFEVTVVTGKYLGSRDEVIDGIKYERIGVSNAGPKLGQFIFYFMLFYYFINKKFDLWMENFTPPFSTNFLQLFTKKPVIGLVYMLVGEDMRRKYKLPFDWIEMVGIKTYKYFITPTKGAREKILKVNPSAFVGFIPNGITFNEVSSSDRKSKQYILFMGRIEINQKGIDLLLNSFSLASKKIDSDLFIAGSGAPGDLQELKDRIKKLGLENRVKLLGRVAGKEKEKLFVDSLFTVIPSRFETFSIVALEALSYGSPILAFDIEGLDWIPNGSVIKAAKFDEEQFSSAMVVLSNNSKIREKMRKVGMEYARKNTWDNIGVEYINYIESII